MDPTLLFTHLKIILLQYFQFSVFSFSNDKFNPNGPTMLFMIQPTNKIKHGNLSNIKGIFGYRLLLKIEN